MKNVNCPLTILIISLAIAGCASTGNNMGKIDRITPEELAKILHAPVATIQLSEIVSDSKQGKTPDIIIANLKTSNSRFELTPSQILDLNRQGVDVKVLDYIAQSNESAKQIAVAEEINKREKEKQMAIKNLKRQRDLNLQYYNRYYDPFFDSYYGGFNRHYYGRGSRFGRGFGLGFGFGNPFGW